MINSAFYLTDDALSDRHYTNGLTNSLASQVFRASLFLIIHVSTSVLSSGFSYEISGPI
jgi:hypothetical protein